MRQKKIVLSTLIVFSFVLLIASAIFTLNQTRDMRKLDPLELESMQKEDILQTIYEKQSDQNVPLFYYIPVFGFFGVVVGLLIYFILSSDLEQKEKTIVYNTEVILKLLNPEERKIIHKIVENQGKIQQVEITYMQDYTKVKAHRIVDKLVQKGILTKEILGKMRLIRLNKELYQILKNE